MFVLLVLICLPSILDFVKPLNVSRERKFLLVEVEYFVDERKYFYTIYCHIYVTIVVATTTILATESLYISYVHHACGMFKIAR